MNKYYEALEKLYQNIETSDLDDKYFEEISNARETLLSLIHKMETIGLELNNTHFMDNDCKLKTLEIIERIFRE